MTLRHRPLVPLVVCSSALWMLFACVPPTVEPSPVPRRIDHIIVAIDSLHRGIALLKEATGIAPVFGGVHAGRGTQNALLSLGGDSYLELLAPNPADARGPAAVASFAKYRNLTPVSWAARTTNADSLRTQLVARGERPAAVTPGSRSLSDGSILRWRTFAPWPGARENLLPFFIEWEPGAKHPSVEAPGGCELRTLRFVATNPDSVRRHLANAAIEVPIARGSADAIHLELQCGPRAVRLPAPAP